MLAVCWVLHFGCCQDTMLAQVPNDDPMLGNGTSAPDGDLELDEDAELTEKQVEQRKQAEESFKVIIGHLLWPSRTLGILSLPTLQSFAPPSWWLTVGQNNSSNVQAYRIVFLL